MRLARGEGGGGEVLVTGTAVKDEPTVADIAKGYIVFELLVGEVLATTFDAADNYRPIRRRWSASDVTESDGGEGA